MMYVIPFLDSISSYNLTWIEAKKAIQTAKIYQIKQTIEETKLDVSKAAIGFIYQEEEEEE